ncbi:carbohydrate kinase family protein [Peptoniphilus raoultii]|uniref:carbohydrate kinase family protein n=1 Tax=Peptoniphilus raoultii TaxID=1776387 RepID=UPI0008DB1A29|nr:carbohydrate kinase family protein [Peptoniphilus raoultii]
MTPIGRNIVDLLINNPFITKEEIAGRLNISPKIVVREIEKLESQNNLKTGKYVTVVGACNIDISGASTNNLVAKDSNPGKISNCMGGVARNICEDLARLEIKTSFISALGTDNWGDLIEGHLRSLNVDTSNLVFFNENTSQYLAILDENRDMALAISDMDLIKKIDPKFLASKREIIENSQFTILDTNLTEDALNFILNNFNGDFLIDGVSTAKVVKLKGLLEKIKFLKVNQYEAQILLAENITDPVEIGKKLIDKGLKSLVISMGKKGAMYFQDDYFYFEKARPCKVKSASGAGDAFMAGYAYGLFNNMELKNRLAFASAAARIALKSIDASSEEFNIKNIEGEMYDNK